MIGKIPINKAEADQDHFVELFAIATVPRANKNAKRFSAKLKSALKHGYDINYMLPDDATKPGTYLGFLQGMSILHVVIQAGRGEKIPIIDELLKCGADPNLLTSDGRNALIIVGKYFRQPEVFSKLIPLTKDINLQDKEGCTAFGNICFNLDWYGMNMPIVIDILKQLLLAGADPFLDSRWENRTEEKFVEEKKKVYQFINQFLTQKEAVQKSDENLYDYEL